MTKRSIQFTNLNFTTQKVRVMTKDKFMDTQPGGERAFSIRQDQANPQEELQKQADALAKKVANRITDGNSMRHAMEVIIAARQDERQNPNGFDYNHIIETAVNKTRLINYDPGDHANEFDINQFISESRKIIGKLPEDDGLTLEKKIQQSGKQELQRIAKEHEIPMADSDLDNIDIAKLYKQSDKDGKQVLQFALHRARNDSSMASQLKHLTSERYADLSDDQALETLYLMANGYKQAKENLATIVKHGNRDNPNYQFAQWSEQFDGLVPRLLVKFGANSRALHEKPQEWLTFLQEQADAGNVEPGTTDQFRQAIEKLNEKMVRNADWEKGNE